MGRRVVSNPFYNPTGNPTPGSSGLSNLIRAEFANIAAAFALLPTLAGNAGGVVVVNASGTGLTVSPVAFPGPTGPFLSLGGGNVIGATTFSSAGTGLTVSNNAVVGGTLGVTGRVTLGSTLNAKFIPVSDAGLVSGDVFVNGAFLCIVP